MYYGYEKDYSSFEEILKAVKSTGSFCAHRYDEDLTVRIENIEIEFKTKKIDEKNWEINKWRKEYPVDYFKMVALLIKPEEAILRDEVFKAIYKIIRLYIPDTVYKYYSLDISEKRNKENLDTLYKGKIYMSEIKDFNDPFDGRAFFYNPKELKNIERLKHCAGMPIDDFCKFIRAACFTDNGVQSMPMWAHYANNHKGFCVSYNVKDNLVLNSNLFPIQYTDQRLDISSEMKKQALKISKSVDETDQRGDLVTMLEDKTLIYLSQLLYNLKHTSWSYEKEYRCITASNSEGMPFIDAKPKAIYIGRNCSDKNAHCLFDIADEHGAKIYKMGFNDYMDNYELAYNEFKK